MSAQQTYDGPQQVRFSSANQEIEPVPDNLSVESLTALNNRQRDDLNPEAQEELRTLSAKLQNSRLQSRRMENFAFEPVSLPPSRVCGTICTS